MSIVAKEKEKKLECQQGSFFKVPLPTNSQWMQGFFGSYTFASDFKYGQGLTTGRKFDVYIRMFKSNSVYRQTNIQAKLKTLPSHMWVVKASLNCIENAYSYSTPTNANSSFFMSKTFYLSIVNKTAIDVHSAVHKVQYSLFSACLQNPYQAGFKGRLQ